MMRPDPSPHCGGWSHILREPGVFWCGDLMPPNWEPGHLVGLEHATRDGDRSTCEHCIAAGIAALESVRKREGGES